MGKQTILLIDDDVLPMAFYITALRQKGYEVEQCSTPDSALDFLKKRADSVKAIVLDIMMPPGQVFKNENTDDGLKTGLLLYNNLAHAYPMLPIVILTNLMNEDVITQLTKKGISVLQKLDYPPFHFATYLHEVIQTTLDQPFQK